MKNRRFRLIFHGGPMDNVPARWTWKENAYASECREDGIIELGKDYPDYSEVHVYRVHCSNPAWIQHAHFVETRREWRADDE